MEDLRAPIGHSRGQRIALAVAGVLIIALGVLSYYLVLVLVPIGLGALAAAAVPSRWPLWGALVAGVLATPAALAVGGVSYVGYSCVRPEPWVEFQVKSGLSNMAADHVLDKEADSHRSSESVGNGLRVLFDRGASDARDRVARELRDDPVIVSVRTGEERCD